MKPMKDLLNTFNSVENISIELLVNFTKTTLLIEEIFERYYKRFGLSKSQFTALYIIYLSGQEGITLSALGDEMVVTRANITTLADRMEARGLIYRTVNPTDRRSIIACITEDGRKILNEILPSHRKFSEEILGFLTEKEKERANEILIKIQNELKTRPL